MKHIFNAFKNYDLDKNSLLNGEKGKKHLFPQKIKRIWSRHPLVCLTAFVFIIIILTFVLSRRFCHLDSIDINLGNHHCKTQLNSIYQELTKYASRDDKLMFPSKRNGLQKLVESGYLSSNKLQCPISHYIHICGNLYWVPITQPKCDFTYIPGAGMSGPTSAIVIEDTSNLANRVNILFSDGQVRDFAKSQIKEGIQRYLDREKSCINYIYVKKMEKGQKSVPICLIYTKNICFDEVGINAKYYIRVLPSNIEGIRDIFLQTTSKKINNKKRYMLVISDAKGLSFFRINPSLLTKKMKADILKKIPMEKHYLLNNIFKLIPSEVSRK